MTVSITVLAWYVRLVLSSDKVPIGSHKTGTVAGRKSGWLGNVTDVGCNVLHLLLVKRPLLEVQPEAIEGDSNGLDVVAIVVCLDAVGLDR